MTTHQTDLLVLGGGPGGYTAAFRAADLGLTVTLVEQRAVLGGVCLNEGCIPSKALLETVRQLDGVDALAAKGITCTRPSLDLDALRVWKDSLVSQLATGLGSLARQRKVKVIQGEGALLDGHRVRVGDVTIAYTHLILAVGSRPAQIPGLPDDPRVMDSSAALAIRDIPARLLVIGGGIIGMEMATVYQGLGSRVTVVEAQGQLLAACDPDLVVPLTRRMQKRLAAIHLSTRVSGVVATERAIEVTLDGPGISDANVVQSFDRVLVAVGRRPNTDQIDLAAIGVPVDAAGLIPVDDQQRTTNPRVFAIGDIVAGPMLAHKATLEGRVAAEVAAGLKRRNLTSLIPNVAYTEPELAWVGLTETQAKSQGVAYERSSFPWMGSGRAHTMGHTDGLTKMLVDPVTHEILGVGMVGPHAGELIAQATLAIEAGLEPGDVALTVHPHPTLSETLAFAAEAFEGTLTELYPPRRR